MPGQAGIQPPCHCDEFAAADEEAIYFFNQQPITVLAPSLVTIYYLLINPCMGKVQPRNADHAGDKSRYARYAEDSRIIEEELFCYNRKDNRLMG
jgi:hypothetical protein